MLLFLELATLGFFLTTVAHTIRQRGREGIGLLLALLFLGWIRENAVALYRMLYSFAPLTLMAGAAPLIGTIIWAYSILLAIVWAEGVTGRSLGSEPSPRLALASGVFMTALVGFYEPFLGLVGMARWEDGTRMTAGVPWIALIGYPSLTWLFLAGWWWAARPQTSTRQRYLRLAAVLLPIAILHAFGLQALKDLLAW